MLLLQAGEPARAQRLRMVEAQIEARGVKNPRVLEAMRRVPRDRFVPADVSHLAYEDSALPIGHGQTISQPYIVAYMTEVLDVQPHHRVLEIGTGSGYQAAVLSGLVKEVYTIEIVAPLAARARQTLEALGHDNVHVREGDGYEGWPEHAPFARIIVTAAPERVPQPLVDQLAPGGIMVIPVGERNSMQWMTIIEKKATGIVERRTIPVAFVPFTRKPGEEPICPN
jgi:protein-L-isoaspartate(D-aspartate) O-methyltransferase